MGRTYRQKALSKLKHLAPNMDKSSLEVVLDAMVDATGSVRSVNSALHQVNNGPKAQRTLVAVQKRVEEMRRDRMRRRSKRPKGKPFSAYSSIFRVVDGAIKAAFIDHPEYVSMDDQSKVRLSIAKRVTGSIISYAKAVKESDDALEKASLTGEGAIQSSSLASENGASVLAGVQTGLG